MGTTIMAILHPVKVTVLLVNAARAVTRTSGDSFVFITLARINTVRVTITVSVCLWISTTTDTRGFPLLVIFGAGIITVGIAIGISVIIRRATVTCTLYSLRGVKVALVFTVGNTITVRVSIGNTTTTETR